MSRSRRSRRIAAAVTVSLAGTPCVSHASATGEDDSAVVVESTGDQTNAVTLPPAAAVGQSATSVTTITLSLGADGQQFDVAIQVNSTATVTEPVAAGGYVAVTTIDHVEVTNAPAGVDTSALGYDALIGVQFGQTFDASGRLVSNEILNQDTLSDAARQAAEGFAGNLQSAQFVYPAEPVGVGAKWSAALEVATEDFAIPTTYTYELTDIADGRYTIVVSYNSSFDTTIAGAAATGTVTGGGTVVGSVDNPLDVSTTIDQTIVATSGGVAVNVVVGIEVVATAA